MVRLAIICTHPIQYYAPVFAQLSRFPGLEVKVFYGWRGLTGNTVDRGFGKAFSWDIPLLENYDYEFVENASPDAGSHHYGGIDLPRLNERIRNWNADALLVYGWRYKSHWRAMKTFSRGIPIYFRGDSTLLNNHSLLRRAARKIALTRVYRHVDIAFSVGTCNQHYFLEYGLRKDQIIHAPHAVANERFAGTTEQDGLAVRKQLGISAEAPVILFCGKLEATKNPQILIQAFSRLNSSVAHLVFVGSGGLESSLRAMAPRHTHFVGFKNQSEMPAYYKMGDVIVLPSIGETWGMVLNEAMACGRAVIASDRVGAAVDLVDQSCNGWVFRSGCLDSLTQSLADAVLLGRSGLRLRGDESVRIIAEWSIANQSKAIAQGVTATAASLINHKKRWSC